MTRKDYQLIASGILSELRCYDNQTPENKAIKELAERLSYELGMDNPRFDSNRFLTACGVK
jgi:hypothetical protein